MTTLENITVSEFKSWLNRTRLPAKTRLTVTFEEQTPADISKRKKATDAMQKLRGSGNGNLVTALLEEREKDKHGDVYRNLLYLSPGARKSSCRRAT